jgi:hypothetical protein
MVLISVGIKTMERRSGMKFEKFKSGKYRQQYQYESFLPANINHEWRWDDARKQKGRII